MTSDFKVLRVGGPKKPPNIGHYWVKFFGHGRYLGSLNREVENGRKIVGCHLWMIQNCTYPRMKKALGGLPR